MPSDHSENQEVQIIPPTIQPNPAQVTPPVNVGKRKYWSKSGLLIIFVLIIVTVIGVVIDRHQLADTSGSQNSQPLTSNQKADKQLLEKALNNLGYGKPTSGVCGVDDCKYALEQCVPSQGMDLSYQYDKQRPSLTTLSSRAKARGWKYEGVDESQVYGFYKIISNKPVCLSLRSVSGDENIKDLNPTLNEASVRLHSDFCTDNFANIDKIYANFTILVPQNMPTRFTIRKQHLSNQDSPEIELLYEIGSTSGSYATSSAITFQEDNTQGRSSFYKCANSCKTIFTTPKGTQVKEFFISDSTQELIFKVGTTYVFVALDIKAGTANERLSNTELTTAIDSMKVISPEQLNSLYTAN